MHNTVVIKGNKSGLTVYLEPDVPFTILLEDIGKKFREGTKFWGAAQMALTLEGRELTAEEEFEVVNQITENSNLEIVCLIDHDIENINRCEKALNEKLMELSCRNGQFYKGSLQSGETIESETSIIIIGDVLRGSKVLSKGNIIVLGRLEGTVCAGVSGNTESIIVALEMAPMQIRIGDYISCFHGKGKRLGRGAMKASLDGNKISVKAMKKSVEIFHNLR